MKEFDWHELLPPRTIETDLAMARAFVEGRRILVTGAGGSIGSELCRQLVALGCASLTLESLALSGTNDELIEQLRTIVPEYIPASAQVGV